MQKLIVGIEETEESRDALRLAKAFAAVEKAEVHVVAVLGYENIATGDDYYEKVHKAHFDQVFSMAWEELGEGYEEHRLTDTSPSAAITELAEELKAAVIVIGSCRRGAIGRLALGDTGTTLTAGSPCPVMVAPRGYARQEEKPAFERIGVGYDGTAESEIALREAARVARETGGGLRLIGVIPHLLSPARIGGTDRGFERLLREEMESRLEAASDLDDLECHVEMRVGNRADELAEASSDLDLLVMGSRGYGPLGRVLLGSVSTKVMRSAACPVVVIPRAAKRSEGKPEVVATLAPFAV